MNEIIVALITGGITLHYLPHELMGMYFERPAEYVSLQSAGHHRCVRRLL